jgi:hypothetical protein
MPRRVEKSANTCTGSELIAARPIPALRIWETALQLHELRLAERSPIGRAEEADHNCRVVADFFERTVIIGLTSRRSLVSDSIAAQRLAA